MNNIIFVNNSRGGVVDEVAMLDALNSSAVKYAVIDVFEQEPPTTANPLLSHPKVFVTPHCAWNTSESIERLTNSAINNVESFIKGKPFKYVV